MWDVFAWHDGDQKPVTVGVYETDAVETDAPCYQHWNGEFWGSYSFSFERAYEERDIKSVNQSPMWRVG